MSNIVLGKEITSGLIDLEDNRYAIKEALDKAYDGLYKIYDNYADEELKQKIDDFESDVLAPIYWATKI